MRNDTDKFFSVRKISQCLYRLVQRILIKRTESFVHKHGIQLDPACHRLDLIRKSQRQGKRGLERFAAGERLYTPLTSIIVIDHIQFQSALVLFVPRCLTSFQFILTAAHRHQPDIRPPQNPVKIRHLHIRFQFNLLLSAHISTCGIRKRIDPFVLFFHGLHLTLLIPNGIICVLIRICRVILLVITLIQNLFPFGKSP